MEESIVLNELEFDDESYYCSGDSKKSQESNEGDEGTQKMNAQKRAKRAPLHQHYDVPLSFLKDAVNSDNFFNIMRTRAPFGNNLEAFLRPRYVDILQLILQKRKECIDKLRKNHQHKRSTLFIIRGSSGIGKSTFLGYFIGRVRSSGKRLSNVAVFYASKSSGSITGDPILSETTCYVVLNGETVVKGEYGNVRKNLDPFLPKMDLIIMDGCSMPFDLNCSGFTGPLIVAGPPRLYVKNLINSHIDHYMLTMPALLDEEAFEIGNMLGVDESVIQDNLNYMSGITRYLFEPRVAKRKVEETVVDVNSYRITKMVSMQSRDRAENRVAVHDLVLWKVGSDFMAVSRFAEKLVAQKLCLETAAKLKVRVWRRRVRGRSF